jgi:phage-related protein
MTTFPGIPALALPPQVAISVGSALEETAKVLTAQFGNNYAQRAGDGINSISGSYAITFENLSRDECSTIVDFFRERAGYKGFVFIVPGEVDERLWRCEKWNRTHVDPISDTLTATFTEVFAP